MSRTSHHTAFSFVHPLGFASAARVAAWRTAAAARAFAALLVLSLAIAPPALHAAERAGAPAGTQAAADPAAGLALTDCELPRQDRPARCGTLEMSEDPAHPDGRRIALKVVVLPARGPRPAPDPVFYLVGGPGGGAVSSAPLFADGFERLRLGRDVVLVDLRGTGGSNPLDCPFSGPAMALGAYLEGQIDPAWQADCLRRLDADPALYTTPLAADDLEAVRRALGYPRIDLIGVSYGSRVALVYLRRHPESVRTVTLRAVSPPEKRLHLDAAASGERALRRVIDDCATDPSCGAADPDLAERLDGLLASLDRQPVRLALPVGGGELTVSRESFLGGLFLLLYDARTAAAVPAVIAAAAGGDFGPFLQAAGGAAGALRGIAAGAYLSVLCAEDVPFASAEEVTAATAGTRLGRRPAERLIEACGRWPRGSVDPGYKQPVRSEAPVLLLSGDRDPTTPPDVADATASHLPNSRHVVVDGLGHLPSWTGCFTDLVARFVEAGTIDGLDLSCAGNAEAPPAAR